VIGDWDGRVQRLGREAFTARTNDRAQLRSATLLRVIRDDDTPMPSFTFDARELAGAARLHVGQPRAQWVRAYLAALADA
jgi:hypothetical protein